MKFSVMSVRSLNIFKRTAVVIVSMLNLIDILSLTPNAIS
jgi:hypothetical protein